MPGVGTNPSTTGHSMLPMNMMAQKVVQTSEAGGMKPMPGSNLSYITLQPPNQPLSLVQDHRAPVYQAPQTYSAPTVEKEAETGQNVDKTSVPNGLELAKAESEVAPAAPKPFEAPKNNGSGDASQEQNVTPQQPQTQQSTPQTQQPQQSQTPQQQPQPSVEESPIAPQPAIQCINISFR